MLNENKFATKLKNCVIPMVTEIRRNYKTIIKFNSLLSETPIDYSILVRTNYRKSQKQLIKEMRSAHHSRDAHSSLGLNAASSTAPPSFSAAQSQHIRSLNAHLANLHDVQSKYQSVANHYIDCDNSYPLEVDWQIRTESI